MGGEERSRRTTTGAHEPVQDSSPWLVGEGLIMAGHRAPLRSIPCSCPGLLFRRDRPAWTGRKAGGLVRNAAHQQASDIAQAAPPHHDQIAIVVPAIMYDVLGGIAEIDRRHDIAGARHLRDIPGLVHDRLPRRASASVSATCPNLASLLRVSGTRSLPVRLMTWIVMSWTSSRLAISPAIVTAPSHDRNRPRQPTSS